MSFENYPFIDWKNEVKKRDAEIQRLMMKKNKCGFDRAKDCTAVCRYYRTCTRNPDYEKLREKKHDKSKRTICD